MKKIVALATLRAQLTGILSLQLAGTITSIANTSTPDDEVTDSASEDSSSRATATIRITMTPVSLPDG